MEFFKINSLALAHYVHEVLDKGDINQQELKDLIDEMQRRGFNAPYRHILKKIFKNLSDEEAVDLSKHMRIFRQIAIIKKTALKRAKISLASFRLKDNLEKKGYTDLIRYLPFDGLIHNKFMQCGELCVALFKDINDLFSSYGKAKKYYVYEVEEFGTFYKLYSKDGDINIPPEAQIKSKNTKIRHIPLIRNKWIRQALITAVIAYAYDVNKHILDNKELEAYNNLLSKYGLTKNTRMDLVEGYEELKEELVKKGFMVKQGNQFFLKKEVAKAIEKTKKRFREKMLKTVILMLFIPIIKHYLKHNKEERKQNNLYPSLDIKPSDYKLKIFKAISHMIGFDFYEVVKQKLEKEEKFESITLSSYLLTKYKDADFTSAFLGVDKSKVNKNIEEIKKYERAERFRDNLRKQNKNKKET